MNKERLLQLADALEHGSIQWPGGHVKEPVYFNMSIWCKRVLTVSDDRKSINCETVACIAGMAVIMYEPETAKRFLDVNYGDYAWSEEAQKILELSDEERLKLFCPATTVGHTTVMAAKTIRYFVETGKIDYPRFM